MPSATGAARESCAQALRTHRCPPLALAAGLALFCATLLAINWMKTQECVYQCSAQMKLRIGNIKIDSQNSK